MNRTARTTLLASVLVLAGIGTLGAASASADTTINVNTWVYEAAVDGQCSAVEAFTFTDGSAEPGPPPAAGRGQ